MITNVSSFHVTGLYVSPDGAVSWGANWLTSSVPPQMSNTHTGVTPGTYDVAITLSNGQQLTWWSWNFRPGEVCTFTVYDSSPSAKANEEAAGEATESDDDEVATPSQ
jgi:hypothetical protein